MPLTEAEELELLELELELEQTPPPSQGGVFGALQEDPPLLNTEFISRIPSNLATAGGLALDAGTAFVEGVQEAPFQTIAGLTTGGKLSAINPIKRALFDVPIQTIAKEADEFFGFSKDNDDIGVNFLEAMAEQGLGEFVAKTGQFMGINPQQLSKKLQDKMSTQFVEAPSLKAFDSQTATDVEKKAFGGKEVFTAEERTGGVQGRTEGAKLVSKAAMTKEIFRADKEKAKLFARNEMIQDNMKKRLDPSNKKEVFDIDSVLDQIKASAESRKNTLSVEADASLNYSGALAESMNKARPFDVTALNSLLQKNKQVIIRAIGKEEYAQTLRRLNKSRTIIKEGVEKEKVVNKLTGGVTFKDVPTKVSEVVDTITTADFFDTVETMLATFSDKQERGTFLRTIWGDIEGMLMNSPQADKEFVENYLEANRNYMSLSELGKAGSVYKKMIGVDSKKVRAFFKDPALYDKAVNVIRSQKGDPSSLPKLLDNFAVEELVNPATREVEYNNVASFIREFGEPNLIKVLGRERVDEIKLVGATSFFLEQNKQIKNIARSQMDTATKEEVLRESGQNLISQTKATGGAIPRANINGSVSVLDHAMAKLFGLTDKRALQKAMLSDIGKSYMKKNLSNPESYPLYVAFARELGVKPVARSVYDQGVADFAKSNPMFSDSSVDTGFDPSSLYTDEEEMNMMMMQNETAPQ